MFWEKVRNLLAYARLDRDQFNKVGPLVASENSFALKLAAIVQVLYFGISFFGSIGVEQMADKRLVYGIGTVIPLVLLIIHLVYSGRHPALMPWLVRCYGVGILLTGLLCTLVCTPDEMTILLLIFFFCVPMIFVMQPVDLILLVISVDVVYFAAAPFLKPAEVLTMDMIDVGIFSTLSVILGVSQMVGRYRRYWLETEAFDLAEVRYQAAFMDQLTGTFNRNAFNKDAEEMEKSPRASDFMFMTADLNGLKAANDSFGHIAGDELIQGTAECMTRSFDGYGKVYRIGGDEFAVILQTKDTTAAELLSTFNRNIETWQGKFVKNLSVSYGVVMSAEAEHMTIHEIELLADKRMYQAKSDYYKNSGLDRRRQ